jgi:2-methylisocitrate lyase-like PEP mutase family enzyme
MTFLVAGDLPAASAGARRCELLRRPEILTVPGAHNGLAALQAKRAGFEAMAASMDCRISAKAQERRDGGAGAMIGEMQTCTELYDLIGYADYEVLDRSIIQCVPPSARGDAQ